MANDNSPIRTTPIERDDPNLRKLARALIAIARQELAQEAAAEARLIRVAAQHLNPGDEDTAPDAGEAA